MRVRYMGYGDVKLREERIFWQSIETRKRRRQRRRILLKIMRKQIE